MKTNLIKEFFIANGFTQGSDVDFHREKNGFLNAVNFQRKSTGEIFFVNLGVHPLFVTKSSGEFSKREVDCYIRTRVSTEKSFNIELLYSSDGISIISDQIERKAWPLFDFFNSVDEVFSGLSIERIENKAIADEISGVTKVRLVSMCMNYHLLRGNVKKAHDFAEYGLSVSGMAVTFKKEFIKILNEEKGTL